MYSAIALIIFCLIYNGASWQWGDLTGENSELQDGDSQLFQKEKVYREIFPMLAIDMSVFKF